MTFTQDDLDRLKAEVTKAGITEEVEMPDGTRVRHRSVTEIQRLQNIMAADVAPAGGRGPRGFRFSPGSSR